MTASAAALPLWDPLSRAAGVQPLERRGPSQKVIVVGAGLAGLCAASRLAEAWTGGCFLVGALLVALTESWQRLGDMAARTIVVVARSRPRGHCTGGSSCGVHQR